jgi:hypothetical protein
MNKWDQFLQEKGLVQSTFNNLEVEKMSQLHSEYQAKLVSDVALLVTAKTSPEDVALIVKGAIEALAPSVSKADYDALVLRLKTSEDAAVVQGNTIQAMKGNSGSSRQTLKDLLEGEKDAVQKSFGGREHSFMVSKALALSTAVTGNTDSFRDDTLSPLATKKLAIYDLFRKVRIGKNNNGTISYRDWDAATTVRGAATVAEGAAFPESTVKWEQFSINIKKIGDSIPYTAEFQYDLARFADELNGFLNMNVKLVEDSQLRAGTGAGNQIFGLNVLAPTYTAVAAGIVDASRYDLIVKLAESVTKGFGNKFRMDYAIMNLTEINKMKLKKDANNNYMMPPFVSRDGDVVSGVRIIEDNGFADNTMTAGDSRYGTIYEDEDGYEITTGMVNNQFLEDEETLKARKRICFLIKESEKAGHRKVTDIAAALTTLAS